MSYQVKGETFLYKSLSYLARELFLLTAWESQSNLTPIIIYLDKETTTTTTTVCLSVCLSARSSEDSSSSWPPVENTAPGGCLSCGHLRTNPGLLSYLRIWLPVRRPSVSNAENTKVWTNITTTERGTRRTEKEKKEWKTSCCYIFCLCLSLKKKEKKWKPTWKMLELLLQYKCPPGRCSLLRAAAEPIIVSRLINWTIYCIIHTEYSSQGAERLKRLPVGAHLIFTSHEAALPLHIGFCVTNKRHHPLCFSVRWRMVCGASFTQKKRHQESHDSNPRLLSIERQSPAPPVHTVKPYFVRYMEVNGKRQNTFSDTDFQS